VSAPDPRVALAEGTPDSGLASMLAELIRQNIRQHPRKEADFLKLGVIVSITARDADVSTTLAFDRGTLTVAGTDHLEPDIRIVADAQTVLDLVMIRIARGVPMVLEAEGRKVVKKLLAGQLRISGLLRHPVQLVRLTRLMSVNG
jgi:hypothetical protein